MTMHAIRITLILAIMGWNVLADAAQTLPQFTFNLEQSSQYGLIINPKYVNLLGSTSALGIELAFGANEFRLGGTLAKLWQCKHLLKLTAEYLSQHNEVTFLTGSNILWTEQHALAAGYSYLCLLPWWSSINFCAYQAVSRDGCLPDVLAVNDNIDVLYRNVKGAESFGGNVGVTLLPWYQARVDVTTYYDDITYRNKVECRRDRSGLGMGVGLAQGLHPRLAFELNAVHRSIYNQYLGKLSWLLPGQTCNGFELALVGQYTQGDLPAPRETRLSLLLTYRWHRQDPQPLYSQEKVINEAARPLVRMPETLVARDESMGLRPLSCN